MDLATIPMYVRSGAILPLDPIRQSTDELVSEPATIQIYTGTDGSHALYEDDGKTLDYQRGAGGWTHFQWENGPKRLAIHYKGSGGSTTRKFLIRLMPEKLEKQVQWDGSALDVQF